MGKLQTVLIMAGGTGGHVFPGLAVAKQLQAAGVAVHWLGTRKGLEARLVPEAGIPIHFISISGLRGKGWLTLLLAPWRLLLAIGQALRIIHHLKPDVVLGLGGFASGPGGVAAGLLLRPLVIHEQNAKAGFTNQCLAYLAAKVLEGFPDTFPNRKHTVTTGNPVRNDIASLPSPDRRLQGREPPMRLLVIGGSLGAAAINDLVPRALAEIADNERPAVYHQTGEKHWETTQNAYTAAGVTAQVVPFITEMAEVYAWADIVLCRAGALTVAELCAVGLGAIFVPYPHAVDDHQTANANYLVQQHAARLVPQTELTKEVLVTLIRQLSASPAERVAMANAAYQLRQVDATHKVVAICEEVCR